MCWWGAEAQAVTLVGNQAPGGFHVQNHAGAKTRMVANEEDMLSWPNEAKAHYRIQLGREGDSRYLKSWYGQEPAKEWPDGGTKRWSKAETQLILPVIPGKEYVMTMDLFVKEGTAAPENGIHFKEKRLVEFPERATGIVTAIIPAQNEETIIVIIQAKSWRPKDFDSNSLDKRPRGVAVRTVTMKAKDATDRLYDANRGEWIRNP